MASRWVVSVLLGMVLALCWHDVTAAQAKDALARKPLPSRPPPPLTEYPWIPIVSDPVEKCLKIPSVQDLDVVKFAGEWFPQWAAFGPLSVPCHIRKFTPYARPAYYNFVLYEYYDDVSPGIIPVLLLPGQVDPVREPRFVLKMRAGKEDLVTKDYSGLLESQLYSMIVVNTDYENYAVIVDCLRSDGQNSVQSVVLFTRDRKKLSFWRAIKMMKSLDQAGNPTSPFRQLDCPIFRV